MISHARRAAPTTASLIAIEAMFALLVAPQLARTLSARTGAGLEPTRLVAGWVERTADSGVRDSLVAIAWPLVWLAAFVLLEPVLHVLFVRGHASPGSRGPLRLIRRVGRTIALRLLVAFGVGVLCALVAACGFAAHVVLDRLGDPRPRDLSVVASSVVAVVIVLWSLLVAELASIRLAIGESTVLEALLAAHRASDRRLVATRFICFVASSTVAALTAFVPHGFASAAPLVVLAIAARALIRSAYIGFVLSDGSARGDHEMA